MGCLDCKYCYRAYNRNVGMTNKYFCVYTAMEHLTLDDLGDCICLLYKKDLTENHHCDTYVKKDK